LGLSNIDLRAASILDVDDSWGQFDYIVCHGVYSWVPESVQDKILTVCARNLAPAGVAYVSYNTYPGWHTRSLLREFLCYLSRRAHACRSACRGQSGRRGRIGGPGCAAVRPRLPSLPGLPTCAAWRRPRDAAARPVGGVAGRLLRAAGRQPGAAGAGRGVGSP